MGEEDKERDEKEKKKRVWDKRGDFNLRPSCNYSENKTWSSGKILMRRMKG